MRGRDEIENYDAVFGKTNATKFNRYNNNTI